MEEKAIRLFENQKVRTKWDEETSKMQTDYCRSKSIKIIGSQIAADRYSIQK